MAKATVTKLYSNFNKGLITETSPLTSVDNSTSDELNMMLSKKGNKQRRYGIDYAHTIALGVAQSGFTDLAIQEYRWNSANNKATANFVCIQIGLIIHFYDITVDPIVQTGTVDVTPYVLSTSTTAVVQTEPLSMAAGNGFLFVAGKHIDPFVVSYDGTSTFTPIKLFILIRDFVGLDDGLGPEVEPNALSLSHQYNLYNQGWSAPTGGGGNTVTYYTAFGAKSTYVQGGDGLITDYFTNVSKYPGNNKLWWWGVGANGGLASNTLKNIAAGNIRAPRGHYLVEAFNIDRSAVSGLSVGAAVTVAERPVTVSFFAGRVWFGCQSTVYYSRVLDFNTYYNANFYCQEADPTSQRISDLVATDGGTIPLPDIGTILKLYPVGSGMLVFGTNGVWFVQGSAGGFGATDVTLSKMSPIGIDSPGSVIEVDSQIFWMSYIGIQGMSYRNGIFGPIQGNFDKLNISLDTIQTYYNTNLTAAVRPNVKAVYDAAANTVQWLFRSTGNGLTAWQYDSALNLDLALQAFYPWKFSNSSGPKIIGTYQDYAVTQVPSGVTSLPTQTAYLTVVPNSSNYDVAVSRANSTTKSDWHSYDSVGLAYNSYVEVGHEILQDAERRKWMPYIFVYFRRTEQNLTTSDGGITYTADFPSSCTMTIKWDFASSTVSNKWTIPTQVYRLLRAPFVDSGSLALDTGFEVVVTKNKVRGNGKAVKFRFENNAIGSDFDLLGWATEYTGVTVP